MAEVKKPYLDKETSRLLMWRTTGGNGSRRWTPIDGNASICNLLEKKIREGSKGVIPPDFKREKTAFLLGGNDIQNPHYDDRGNGKGVSVIFAAEENTYMCVFDRQSVKFIDSKKPSLGKSIKYKKVFVPKGRAFYFDAFHCLHGGYKYHDNDGICSNDVLQSGGHLRLFCRFIQPARVEEIEIDFHLLGDDIRMFIEET
jgi:hypothetical protein